MGREQARRQLGPFLVDALKADPETLDLARSARARGISLRALLGWTPTQTITPQEGGGWTVTTETEWDYTERNIAVALDEIDRQTCGGCGGDLSVELTDKPPHEDDGDGHFHRFTPLWCRRCVSSERNRKNLERAEKDLIDGPADPFPAARRFAIQRLPIPTND